MLVLSFLVGLVGVTTGFQHNWWDKEWSNSDSDTTGDGKAKFRNLGDTVYGESNTIVGGAHFNQIDHRYPDWVVYPRPQCTQEGVFPHPRSSDCTWYYRCAARVGVPIYATFYFQCEPGTMFDDDLDQCVHPHSGSNCQGGPSPPPPEQCTPLQSSCGNYQACENRLTGATRNQYMCRKKICTPSNSVRDYCPAGQLMDINSGRCMIKPEPCPPVCPTPVQSSCKNYQGCGGATQYMCRLQNNCGGSVTEFCPRGQLKDMASGRCMDIPQDCPPDLPETKCEAICKSVQVCTPTSYTAKVCEYERCTRGGQDAGVRRMCGVGNTQVYDVDQKRCIAPPNEKCGCEYTKTNCRNYDLCNPSGVQYLCDCHDCGQGKMYDPNAKVCVDKSILCPTLECVFRDDKCSCVNGMSLCTGCYMRGNFIHLSQFCKEQSNPIFYHVESDSCQYSVPPNYNRDSASNGNCPRTRDSMLASGLLPSLTCSIRKESIVSCWADDMN